MDAVELPAIVVSKLMGSDGFGGVGGSSGVGVKVKEFETRESDLASIQVGSSIDRCSSFLSRKDEMGADSASESVFWNKMPDVELCRHANRPSCLHGENTCKDLNNQSLNSSPSTLHGPEAKHLHRKSGKVARSSSGSSKRSRTAQLEVSAIESGPDDVKEKTHMAKQKNHLNGKRGDKRNGKVLMKSKYESFSLKAGLLSFSSSAGGNNILGLCGSKPDISDVINHVGELSLNELLDGSYKCPSFAKDKGKKAANLNESLVDSVKKACSILRLQKPLCPQNVSEIDSNYNLKVSTSLVSSGSCVAGKSEGDEGDACTIDQSSPNKDPCSKLETSLTVLDCPLYHPEDILERLALPPSKDLDSLLLDTAKPVSSSRNNPDLRLGKSVSHRTGLPPFAWSQTSGAHCKSNSDAVKLSTSRTTCQGRWVKIENTTTSTQGPTDFLVDLETLTYNQNLVPSANIKTGLSETKNVPSTSISVPNGEQGISSSMTLASTSQVPAEAGESPKFQGNGHSPSLLAAAQTLHDIATRSWKQNQHGMTKWPKKPSQKAMKARKLKSSEKSEGNSAALPSATERNDQLKNSTDALPLKKPRLNGNEKTTYYTNYSSSVSKGPLIWSAPKSSRSSPSKSIRPLVAETKQYSSNMLKQSCSVPPPPRFLDGASNRQQKVRKVMPMEWNRAGGKLD